MKIQDMVGQTFICLSNCKLYTVSDMVKFKGDDNQWINILEYRPLYECDIQKFFRSHKNFSSKFMEKSKFIKKYKKHISKAHEVLTKEYSENNKKIKIDENYIIKNIKCDVNTAKIVILRLHENNVLDEVKNNYFLSHSKLFFEKLFK